MKRLSFFRLTRCLPATIALSGITALGGCVNTPAIRHSSSCNSSACNSSACDSGCGSCGTGGGHRLGLIGSIDRCAQVQPGALPQQNGASVRAFHKIQKENADLDKYVVYLHEWYQGGPELGPWGRNHLVLIAKRLGEVKVPVVVQAGLDDQLNQTRKNRIIEHLSKFGIHDAAQRVEIGYPESLDLDGNEAPRIYLQMLTPNNVGNNNNNNNNGGNGNFGNNNGFGGNNGFGNNGFGNNFGGGNFGGGNFGGGGFQGGRPFGF